MIKMKLKKYVITEVILALITGFIWYVNQEISQISIYALQFFIGCSYIFLFVKTSPLYSSFENKIISKKGRFHWQSMLTIIVKLFWIILIPIALTWMFPFFFFVILKPFFEATFPVIGFFEQKYLEFTGLLMGLSATILGFIIAADAILISRLSSMEIEDIRGYSNSSRILKHTCILCIASALVGLYYRGSGSGAWPYARFMLAITILLFIIILFTIFILIENLHEYMTPKSSG